MSPIKPSFSRPTLPRLIPHRLRRKLASRIRSRQSPASSFGSLETSWDPKKTVYKVLAHKWTLYDLQHLVVLVVSGGSLYLNHTFTPLIKTSLVTLMTVLLTIPITSQFFLPFMPIFTYLVFFFSCGSIPSHWRPDIWVRLLPAVEKLFYGANLSGVLSAHQAVIFDLLAWVPYGLLHFALPFFCSGIIFLFGPPGSLPVFARAFGFMNVCGIMIQLMIPTAPPWYENLYGSKPADYSIHGSAAGLARVDAITGLNMYTDSFNNSPMVFGAFPSMHAGDATIQALFLSEVLPQFSTFFGLYVAWLWWSTMYLSHHYMVDLIGGSLLATLFFQVAKNKFFPRRQPGKTYRWDYDFAIAGYSGEPEAEADGKLNLQAWMPGDGDIPNWLDSTDDLSPSRESRNEGLLSPPSGSGFERDHFSPSTSRSTSRSTLDDIGAGFEHGRSNSVG